MSANPSKKIRKQISIEFTIKGVKLHLNVVSEFFPLGFSEKLSYKDRVEMSLQ